MKHVSKRDAVNYGKRKFSDVQCATVNSFPTSRNVPATMLGETCCDQLKDLTGLMNSVKDTSSISSRKEKILLLTLTPPSWTVQQAAYFFDVSQYAIRQARKLKSENGLLRPRNQKQGESLSEELVALVQNVYTSDEISHMCPWKKDFLSVAFDGQKQQTKEASLMQV